MADFRQFHISVRAEKIIGNATVFPVAAILRHHRRIVGVRSPRDSLNNRVSRHAAGNVVADDDDALIEARDPDGPLHRVGAATLTNYSIRAANDARAGRRYL